MVFFVIIGSVYFDVVWFLVVLFIEILIIWMFKVRILFLVKLE